MAAIQLSFSLRTSSSTKTVHLLGNWDNYKGQLPLSKDSKPGQWKGTFRFQGSTLKQGQRYWYYYIIDGIKVSHDPSQRSTVEPTTKRTLNILDIPGGDKPSLSVNTSSSRSSKHHSTHSKRDSTHADVPHGRSLSPSKIVSPRPQKPHEARRLANARYSGADVDKISHKLAATRVSNSSFSSSEDSDSEDYSDSEIESDASSDLPSLTSNSSRGSPISPSSPASSVCSCDRWGVTKSGGKVKLDCGGSRCGSSGSDLSSDSEEEYVRTNTKLGAARGEQRRHGVVVRHSRR